MDFLAEESCSCRVAFALNSKKLRKSSFSEPSSSSSASSASSSSSSSSTALGIGAETGTAATQSSPSSSSHFSFSASNSIGQNCHKRCSGAGDSSSRVATKGGEWRGGGLADILSDEVTEGVQFFVFEQPSSSNQQQPVYDVIIHKLTEDLEKEEDSSCLGVVNDSGDACSGYNTGRLLAIRQYLKDHPQTVIIDPFESVKIVISRARTAIMLDIVCSDVYNCVQQPQYVLIEDVHDLTAPAILEKMQLKSLKFPIICKPLQACGSPTSHQMVVVVNSNGLNLITFPCVIQQYHDHSSVFYKAYVIGNEVMVFRRPSLPDLATENATRGLSSLAFDSRFVYPGLKDFTKDSGSSSSSSSSTTVEKTNGADLGDAATITSSSTSFNGDNENDIENDIDNNNGNGPYKMFMSEFPTDLKKMKGSFLYAASSISEHFGLSLFGFDVILPVGDDNKILIIDVNFFPSYKEVSDFPSKLRRHFRRKANATLV